MSYSKDKAPLPQGDEDNLARRLRRERENRGWSFSHMARAVSEAGASMPPNAVSRIESRERRITVDELLAFARVLGTSVDGLLTDLDALDDARAAAALRTLAEGMGGLFDSAATLALAFRSLAALRLDATESGADVADYVEGHLQRTLAYPEAKFRERFPEPNDDDLAVLLAVERIAQEAAVQLLVLGHAAAIREATPDAMRAVHTDEGGADHGQH